VGTVPRAPECFHISFVEVKVFLSEDALEVASAPRNREKEKEILQNASFFICFIVLSFDGRSGRTTTVSTGH
jgi:hypothetical protein